MSFGDLQALGMSFGALLVLVTSGYSAWKARRADQQTRATGNGWADRVEAKLTSIETKIDTTDGKIDRHLEAHADSDLRKPSPPRRL